MLQVGNEGVSAAFLRSLDEAFRTRELLKVKVLESAPESARESADLIVARAAGVQVAQTIGRTVVLYRPLPDGPEIELPR